MLGHFDVVRDETPSDDDSLTELRMVRVVDLGFRRVFAGSMPCDRVVAAPPSSCRFSCKSVPPWFAAASASPKVLIMAKAAEWTARRARTAQEQGRPQGPEGSLGKLASSLIARAAARVHTSLLGPDALLTGDDSPMNGLLAEILVSVPATSIAGGTDEIQRNIISERVLKMPRERTGDTDKPFKDVPRNTVA